MDMVANFYHCFVTKLCNLAGLRYDVTYLMVAAWPDVADINVERQRNKKKTRKTQKTLQSCSQIPEAALPDALTSPESGVMHEQSLYCRRYRFTNSTHEGFVTLI